MTYVSPDVQRILDLPRASYPPRLAERLSEAWRAPGGSWVLRDEQARFLFDLARYRGAVGGLAVGAGKSLVAMLAPLALGVDPSQVLVLLPASLIPEAAREREKYLEHFALPGAPRYVSYSKLSHRNAVNLLDEIGPSVILCDEAHALRNSDTACTLRMTRYLRRNPETVYAPLSGTLAGGKIFDYARLLRWAMGSGAAVPRERRVLDAWSRVLDVDAEEAPTGYDYRLIQPLCDWAGTTVHRAALYERLSTAPGMVLSTRSSCDQPLTIRTWKPRVPEAVRDAIARVDATLELPDGTEVIDLLRLVLAKKQLSLGFYMRWQWPVAGEIHRKWLKMRSNYYREVRGVTRRGKEGYETVGLVEQALAAGGDPYLPASLYAAAADWAAVRDEAEPVPEAVWYDDSILLAAVDKARAEGRPTIIWYYHTCVGEALRNAGVSTAFAGEPVPEDDVVALSIASHGTGLNLQRLKHNLVLEPPSNAGTWEQMLGRTHRGGQADPVTCTVLSHTSALSSAITKAKARARYVEETTGMNQKLNHARWAKE